MAQAYQTDAGTIIIPSAVASWTVATQNSGLSTSGTLIIVGEADAGPDFSLESSIQDNCSFGPDEISSVLAKYRSGNLVDAFQAAAAPANDPNIQGAPTSIILVKTNPSVRAKLSLAQYGGAAYCDLADHNYGASGNMIFEQVVAATSEVVPTTGAFTWINNVAAVNIAVNVNGGAPQALTLSANRTPAQLVTAINTLSGVTATGGALRIVVPSIITGTLAIAPTTGNSVTVTYSSTWTTIPTVGDTMVIPSTSVIKGATNKNVGSYVVTGSNGNTISATKLSDAAMPAAQGNAVTAPTDVVNATNVVATTDVGVYSPVIIALTAANPLPGIGKSLEISELSTGTDLISWSCFTLAGAAVSWISKTGASQLLVSATEYSADLKANRQSDNIQEEMIAGGEIALSLGYIGTSATVVVGPTTIAITRTGGSGADIGTLNIKDFPTLADLQSFINSKTGYTCSLGNAILGQLPPSALDEGTFTFCSTWGAQSGRLKIDAYRFYNKVAQNSVLVRLQTAAGVQVAPSSGLPGPTAAVA